MQDVINLISTCGFPIACCVFMMFQNYKQQDYSQKQIEQLRETVDNNTKSVNELTMLVKELIRRDGDEERN